MLNAKVATQNNSTPWIAYAELTMAMVLVGSLSVVGKLIIASFPIMLSSFVILFIAAVFMSIAQLLFRRPLLRLKFMQLKYLFYQTFFGIFLFRVFFFLGLFWVSAATAGLLISLTPLMVAFLAVIFMGESLTKALGFSLLFCTTGLVICQYHELSIATGGQEFIGLILVLLAAICEALFVILRKKVNSIAVDPFTANTYLCYIGAALFLPFALWDLRSFSFSGVSAKAYVPLIYSALFVNIAAFTLWFRGCDKVSSVTSGVFIGVMPVSALILSYIFLHEPINLSMVIGIALVITGLLIIIVPIGNSKPGLKP